MSEVAVNGVQISYDTHGEGEPVLLIMGQGSRGRVWEAFQVPAIVAAGFQAITFDNRGIPPSSAPEGPYRLSDMAADTIGLIEALGIAPCHAVGVSLGALILQEAAIARPDLLCCAALIATKARTDAVRRAHLRASQEMYAKGLVLPAAYRAVIDSMLSLSPATLNDDKQASTWLDLFEYRAEEAGAWAQLAACELADRRPALAGVRMRCLVIGFEHDLTVPPHLGREVADAIPGCQYTEISNCGHLGHLERPEAVNAVLLEFLQHARPYRAPQDSAAARPR